jgi:hypothetical protein
MVIVLSVIVLYGNSAERTFYIVIVVTVHVFMVIVLSVEVCMVILLSVHVLNVDSAERTCFVW